MLLNTQAEFCGVGDKMSISRITAYESEIGRIAAIKTERTATITALCEHINDLWAELDVKPADEYDQIIRAPVSTVDEHDGGSARSTPIHAD